MIGGHIVKWHYFNVLDEYLGIYQKFRWREAPCDFRHFYGDFHVF